MANITPLPPVLNPVRPLADSAEGLAFARLNSFKGKYEFLSVLGSGGMGVVYKARQVLLNKLVAIKMIRTSGFSEQALKRFEREAKAASTLLHPNLITIRDYGVGDEGQPYMVFDFIDGTTLAQIIKTKGQLELDRALDIFIQVAKGLSYAHQHGVLHRDIKPDNIIIAEGQKEVKIVDFGIAKVLDDNKCEQTLTQTGEIFGTPLYMSPEQGVGKKLDARSDLYSMGCVMFEALTAVPPFVGESVITTMIKHHTETPTSLKEASLGREFPQALEHVVATLLAKNPEERYQSAQELIDDLIKIRSGPGSDLTQTEKVTRPYNIQAGVLAALMVISILGTMFAFVQNQNHLKAMQDRSVKLLSPPSALTQSTTESPELKVSPATTSTALTTLDSSPSSTALSFLESRPSAMTTVVSALDARPSTMSRVLTALESSPSMSSVLTAFDPRPSTMSTASTALNAKPATQPTALTAPHTKPTAQSAVSNAPESRLASLLTGLDLSGKTINPELIEQINGYTKLKELNLRGGKFIGHPLGYLKNDINSIDFSGSNVCDEDLEYVKVGGFPEELIFDHTAIGDKAMHLLILECALVKVLSLNYTKITDTGLSNLGEQFSLKILRLNGDKISDNGLKALHWFKNLEELELRSVTGGVTGKGIGYLAEHHALRKISISDISLIAPLAQLHQVHEISIYSDKVSDEALLPLKKLPDLVRLTIYTERRRDFSRTIKALPFCCVQLRSAHPGSK
jgi:eukaryotic-like serine/threonine-protein kinase